MKEPCRFDVFLVDGRVVTGFESRGSTIGVLELVLGVSRIQPEPEEHGEEQHQDGDRSPHVLHPADTK